LRGAAGAAAAPGAAEDEDEEDEAPPPKATAVGGCEAGAGEGAVARGESPDANKQSASETRRSAARDESARRACRACCESCESILG